MASHPQAFQLQTVDLSAGGAGARLGRALEATGFVQLVGHGLDEETFANFRLVSDQFFDLDDDVKKHYVHDDPAANRGYRSRGSEALSYSLGQASPPDLFESFNAAPSHDEFHRLLQATPWPDEVVPGFSDSALSAFAAMRRLATRIDDLIEHTLGIEWLTKRSTRGPDMLASINYRPGPDGTETAVAGQQRMGAHSDYTTFTILLADPVPGLQIVSPEGGWVDVVPEAGALLLNVGDVLAILTNDRWPSTLHRVVPMSAGAAARRRSVAYFHYPDLDVEVEPLTHLLGDDAPKYRTVSVEEHLLDKLVSPKVHEVARGTSTVAGRSINAEGSDT